MSDEKPATLALMEEEWNKLGDAKPPAPTRGIRVQKGASVEDEDNGAVAEAEAPDPEDLVDRTNIRYGRHLCCSQRKYSFLYAY